MLLSQEMIQAGTKFLKASQRHPFVRGVIEGTLTKGQLKYYDEQDLNFEFNEIEVITALLNNARTTHQAELFKARLDVQTNMLDTWLAREPETGVNNWQALRSIEAQPMNQMYQQHMTSTIRTNQVLQILPAFLAGEWIYVELGRFVRTQKRVADKPFDQFWAEPDLDFLGDDGFINQFFAVIDEEAKHATEAERERAKATFLKSCLMEWYFWDDAYKQTTWDCWENIVLNVVY